MKLQLAFLFVALFAFACASNSYWGSRNNGDFLLTKDTVNRNWINGSYISVPYSFPNLGQINNRTITAIYVYDKYPNNRGAVAYLWSGGPGYKYAAIDVKSQYEQGINSTVEIYGR